MARVVIIGAGMGGLSTALLLAKDGFDVTVVERDPDPPPPPDQAWASWERRGVNQFRQLHFLLPRWRAVAERELPELLDALHGAGALRFNLIERIPEEIVGRQPDDHELTSVTARRPVMESAVAAVVAAIPTIDIRRGVGVSGLLADLGHGGIPHVTGIRTEQGEDLGADLVVDCSGRRSPLPAWLEAVGARPPAVEEEDLGFVYYGRHFRSGDGSIPPLLGGLLQAYDSVSTLTLPADDGTWGLGIIASGADRELRALKDDDVWMRVWEQYPLVAHWIDAEPLHPVAVMARIPDRLRRFVIDGEPVATGVVAVGDAWACTNPSLGRGITIGLLHSLALRDLLRQDVLGDPRKLALEFEAATEATVTPLYEATNQFDRHRLAEIQAQIEGVPYEPGDQAWEITKAFMHATGSDPEVLRALLRVIGLLRTPDEQLAQPGIFEKVIEHGAGWRDAPPTGPGRADLVKLVGA